MDGKFLSQCYLTEMVSGSVSWSNVKAVTINNKKHLWIKVEWLDICATLHYKVIMSLTN